MLSLPESILERIVAQALREHPLECCGVVAKPIAQPGPLQLIPLVNSAASERHYELSPEDLFRLYQTFDQQELMPYVIYHSHPQTSAYLSQTDIELASEPDAFYLVVSTASSPPTVKAFRLSAEGPIEQELRTEPD